MSRALSALRRRFRTLRDRIRSPSDALLTIRLLAWRPTLFVLKRTVPIQSLVRLMVGLRPPRVGDARRIVDFVDWVYASRGHRDLDNCLERSLVLYRYLSPHEPRTYLVIGMRRGTEALEGHAWVTAGGRALGATPGSGEDFVSLAAFDTRGRRLESIE